MDTETFRNALATGQLIEAETFLNDVLCHPEKYPQYDNRWLDHRQRELFQAFYQVKNWQGAKRVVEATKAQKSYEGRKNRLEELSGMKYEEI